MDEVVKHYTFKRESNNFKDILNDPALKKYIRTQITWANHLMIGLSDATTSDVLGYLILKYGEEIYNPIEKDYTPIPNIDYVQKRSR